MIGTPRQIRRATNTTARPEAADAEVLRSRLGPFWERHEGTAARAVANLGSWPVTADEASTATAQLAAVHVFMTAVDDTLLRTSLTDHDATPATMLRCLASGLLRLPARRGPAVSVADELTGALDPLHVGTVRKSTLPIRATAVEGTYPDSGADHVLLWSETGRVLDTLTGPGEQDTLFARGSRFRVLGVARRGTASVGMLRELPADGAIPGREKLTAGWDTALLYRLRAVLDLPPATTPGDVCDGSG
ncbi:hypothetical protein ACWGJV_35535 [Streptomyces tendae]